MGAQADYSLEVAHEIDEEVRALIEAAHTEAWEILNTYRDVLDDLVFELLEKETLTRIDLERIFDRVEKRPRITAFNDFGERTPSDKPPIKTPAERAKERGEPWPPHTEPVREPTPVGSYPGGSNGLPAPGPNGVPNPVPPGGYPGGPGQPPFPAAYPPPGQPVPPQGWGGQPQPNSVPHNYGAPPDWRPATTPRGQSWPPPGHWQQPAQQPAPQWAPPNPNQAPPAGGNGTGEPGGQQQPQSEQPPKLEKPGEESGTGQDEGGAR
jgi:cell division protease FtsH